MKGLEMFCLMIVVCIDGTAGSIGMIGVEITVDRPVVVGMEDVGT